MSTARIAKDDDDLCFYCQGIDLKKLLLGHEISGAIQLRGYQDILRQEDCSLCRLVIRALSVNSRGYWRKGRYPTEICYLGQRKSSSRPPSLQVWFQSTAATLPEGMSGHMTTFGQILPLGGICIGESAVPFKFSNLLSGSHIDYAILRYWIDTCRNHHGSRCHSASTKPVKTMLIDIKRMRIGSHDYGQRYICLSYVWGNCQMFQTTIANLSKLQEENSLIEHAGEIPKTIKDAIALVASLGERYLWVDSLCIVQDDAASKHEQISRMDEIYNHAELTIVALTGSDANFGLPGVTNRPRCTPQIPETIHGFQLIAKLPGLIVALSKSKWDTRAWTFQEKLLSRRCLFLSDSQAYFQCQSSYCAEDSVEAQDSEDSASAFTNPFTWVVDAKDTYRSKLNIYESLVACYSRRSLSYHSDSLNAFAGVLSHFNYLLSWTFVSGLPEQSFDLALLWRPIMSIIARPRAGHGSVCKSPTWCWTAWMGNIFCDPWHMHSYVGAHVSLRSKVEMFMFSTDNGLHRVRRNQEKLHDDRAHEGLLSKIHAHLKGTDDRSRSSIGETPHIPNMLLFFTACTAPLSSFSMSTREERAGQESTTFPDHPKKRRAWETQIYDLASRRCGTLHALDPTWISTCNPLNCDFVLLSHCTQRKVTDEAIANFKNRLPPEYPSSREYYEAVFDTERYGFREDWAVNVMLIEWQGCFARRVATGQIHADAWSRVQSRVKLIALA